MQTNPLFHRPLGYPTSFARPSTHTVGLGLARTPFVDTFHREKAQKTISHRDMTSPGAMTPQGLHEYLQSAERPSTPIDKFKALLEQPGLLDENRERRFQHFDTFPFHKAPLNHADFTGSSFSKETDFSHSFGTQANFTQCDLPKANFQKSILSGANFHRADLPEANFNHANLEKLPEPKTSLLEIFTAPFHGYPVPPSSFKAANLAGAQFKHANLKNVNFKNANLTNANFEHANLENADLTGARILNANFKDANLKGAKVNLAATVETELLVDESNVPKAVMELAELATKHKLDLGLDDPKTKKNIKEVFEAKERGLVTQDDLEDGFRLFYQHAELDSRYEELTCKKYISYIFQKINDNIFDDLHSPVQSPPYGSQHLSDASRNSSFAYIDPLD